MEIYLVGGAVRDNLLNKPVHERDYVVVGGTPEAMLKKGFRQVGKDFPVFLHPQTGEEYALARTERKSATGYTGFTVYAAADVSLETDLLRRDLTINAIAQDQQGQLIDPYGGIADLKDRWLRHVSPAFVEDPLRVLRVARFAARFAQDGFSVAPEAIALMRTISTQGELETLAAERVWRETEKALHTDSVDVFWQVIDDAEAWSPWFIELQHRLNIQELTQQLERLHQFSEPAHHALISWALTCGELSIQQHTLLAERLRIPSAYQQFVEAAKRVNYQPQLKLTPDWLFNAICRSDSWRREDRFSQLVAIWQAQGLSTQTAEQLMQLYAKAQQVSAQEIMTEAKQNHLLLAGPAIGEAVRQRQLAVINANWPLSI